MPLGERSAKEVPPCWCCKMLFDAHEMNVYTTKRRATDGSVRDIFFCKASSSRSDDVGRSRLLSQLINDGAGLRDHY